jgi:hypothetical protein
MVNESRRLSTGPTPAGRIVGAVFGVVVLTAVGLFFASLGFIDELLDLFAGHTSTCLTESDIAHLPPELMTGIDLCNSWSMTDLGPGQIAGLLLGAATVLLGVFLALGTLRDATWLEGSVLRVRGAVRTRTVDLATAEVTAGIVTHSSTNDTGVTSSRRVPTLVARDPVSGRRLTLRLRGAAMDRLPPAELRALADAIVVGRPESDTDAYRVATQLREMADNPLELPRR